MSSDIAAATADHRTLTNPLPLRNLRRSISGAKIQTRSYLDSKRILLSLV